MRGVEDTFLIIKKMAKKKITLTYTTAMEELKVIVDQLEEGLIQIDELAAKSSRAAELIEFCRTKLRDVSAQVNSNFESN